MHDLRRQALESNKTVSRKARSRIASATSSKATSKVNSPAGSRAPSRQGSDDEEYLSDGTAWRYVVTLCSAYSGPSLCTRSIMVSFSRYCESDASSMLTDLSSSTNSIEDILNGTGDGLAIACPCR